MTGGEIIRELRTKKDITLKDLASKVGVNYMFLSRVERGKDTPSEELIKKLADTLNYENDVNVLIASFGRIPSGISEIILANPEITTELSAFFKSKGL